MFDLALPYRNNDLSLVRAALRVAGVLMSADDHLMRQAFDLTPDIHKSLIQSCIKGCDEIKRLESSEDQVD